MNEEYKCLYAGLKKLCIKKHLLIAFISICSLFYYGNKTYSQNTEITPTKLDVWIDSLFEVGLDSFSIPGATFILMQGDSVLYINGYGIVDIESRNPVSKTSSIFNLGSISKTLVGTAIMQLYEDGKIELDSDINNYFETFQIDPSFGDTITIKHLLTHVAGFDERNIGVAVRTERDVISLAQYLEDRMPKQIRPVGEALTYSNHGYGLLGLIVEKVSGLPFHEYVREMILEPLEMDHSGFERNPEYNNNYASSYLQKDDQLILYKPDFLLNYPPASFSSTAQDMGNYIAMFLNDGNFKGRQILDSITVSKMRQTAFKHYDKAENGWLLGFYEKHWNGLRLIRHEGEIQGFASDLILIPDENIGFFISVNSSSMPDSQSRLFIQSFNNKLLSRLLPESIPRNDILNISPKVGTVEEPLSTFSGTYRFTRYAQKTLDKVAVLIGFAPEVEIISKGNTLEILDWNDKLIPISDLTFYSTNNKKYIAFGRDSNGEISYLFSDTDSYHKLKWYEPVKFQIYWIGTIVLVLLISIIISTLRKLFAINKKSPLIKKMSFSIAITVILFLSSFVYVMITTDPMEFTYGIPSLLRFILLLPFVLILLELYACWLLIKAWYYKEMGTLALIYQSLIIVVALTFIPWLMYWNLIGFNY